MRVDVGRQVARRSAVERDVALRLRREEDGRRGSGVVGGTQVADDAQAVHLAVDAAALTLLDGDLHHRVVLHTDTHTLTEASTEVHIQTNTF